MGCHCSNCGTEMDPNAAICVKCGFAKGTGKKYCSNCGSAIDENAAVCLNCGFAISNIKNASGNNSASGSSEILLGKQAEGNEPVGEKSRLIAGLLYIFLSGFGAGDFYLGYTKTGIIRLVITAIGLWIFGIGLVVNFVWGIISAIYVFTDKKLDADGFALKKS